MTTYRCSARGHHAGDQLVFTMHVNNPTGTTAAALSSWVDGLISLWDTGAGVGQGIAVFCPVGVGIDVADAVALDSQTGRNTDRAEQVHTANGQNANEQLPGQCALAVSLRTAQATRAGRGRFYLPPFSVDQMAAGRLSTPAQLQVFNAITAMITTLQGHGYAPVVFHRALFDRTTVPPTLVRAASFTPINRWDVGDVIDTQRRRRNKLIETRKGS